MTQPIVTPRQEYAAKLSCAFGGAAWGLFWIPLRALEDANVSGAWPTVLFFLVPCLILIPLFALRWRSILAGGLKPQVMGILCGSAIAIYANSVLYTDVIRAMLLYYMTPIWSIFLARLLLGESINFRSVLAIALGVAGMMIILHVDKGFPWPQNLGDWFGLLSGVVWAFGAVALRSAPDFHAVDLTCSFLFWSMVAAVAMAFMPFAPPPPSFDDVMATMWWLVPATLVVVVPAFYAVMWGAPKLNPGVVGLFFLTEIVVGAITVAIWADEPFGVREITGVLLISLAGVLELIYGPIRRLLTGKPDQTQT